MHDLKRSLIGLTSIEAKLAVLCGVEALSAQGWAVGAISLCADVFAQGAGWDLNPGSRTNFARPFSVSCELKGEG
jgi:hypothetical protein